MSLRQERGVVHICMWCAHGAGTNARCHQCLQAVIATCPRVGTIRLLSVLQSSRCATVSRWGFNRLFLVPREVGHCVAERWASRFPHLGSLLSIFLLNWWSFSSSTPSSPSSPTPSFFFGTIPHVFGIFWLKLLQIRSPTLWLPFTNLMVHVNEQNFFILMRSINLS